MNDRAYTGSQRISQLERRGGCPIFRLPSSVARPLRLSVLSSRIQQVRPARWVSLQELILSMCSRLPWAEPICTLLRLSQRSRTATGRLLARPQSLRACSLEQMQRSSQLRSLYADQREPRPCHEISLPRVLPPQVRSATSTTSLDRTWQRATIENSWIPEYCRTGESCALPCPGLALLGPLRARTRLEFWLALAGSLLVEPQSPHRYSHGDRLPGCLFLPTLQETGRFRLLPQLRRAQETWRSSDIPHHHSNAAPQPTSVRRSVAFSLLGGPHQRLPCASSHPLQPPLRLSSRPS